jgi:hypothetical protein
MYEHDAPRKVIIVSTSARSASSVERSAGYAKSCIAFAQLMKESKVLARANTLWPPTSSTQRQINSSGRSLSGSWWECGDDLPASGGRRWWESAINVDDFGVIA